MRFALGHDDSNFVSVKEILSTKKKEKICINHKKRIDMRKRSIKL